ncbi:MAG: hypothetical protein KDC98_22870, partial [Planctomycetes bacterium]|nr:hypothetical protein [Planctomycetota bacterium]
MSSQTPQRRCLGSPGLRRTVVAAASLAVALTAQAGQPGRPTARQQVPLLQGAEESATGTVQPEPADGLEALTPQWAPGPTQRPFLGFPTFPSKLPGYGAYPMSLSQLLAGRELGEQSTLPPIAVPIQPGWPSWVKLRGRPQVPYQPDLALLVQSVERVWWRDRDEEAFVPLYSYDKLRPIGVGVDVEIRHAGQFEVLFHGGSRLSAHGLCKLKIDELSEESVAVTASQLTRIRLEAFGREHRLTLPDGSVLVVPKSMVEAPPPMLPGLLPPMAAGASPQATQWEPALIILER